MNFKDKLKELKPHSLNCNVFDVYSYNGLSMQELLCQFFTKINECVAVSNDTIDLAKWLVNEGLEKEVAEKLVLWYEDGSLEELINVNLFENLNEKINNINSNLNEEINNINSHLENIKKQNNFVSLESFKLEEEENYDNAFTRLQEYIITNAVKKIILPTKTIKITKPIVFSNEILYWDLIFEGGGQGIDGRGSCIDFKGSGYLFTFDLRNPVAGFWRGVTFKNVTFRGDSANANNGIKLIFNQQAFFENCVFSTFSNALKITGDSHYANIKNCKFISNTIGINVPFEGDSDFISGGANNLFIENCFFTYCSTPIRQGDGSGWIIQNCDIEGYNGKSIISNDNILQNIRIERNNSGAWLELGNKNKIINLMSHSDGGNYCNPLLEINGSLNDIEVSGSGYKIVDTMSPNYNKIKVIDWKTLLKHEVFTMPSTYEVEGVKYSPIKNNLNEWTTDGLEWIDNENLLVKREGNNKIKYTFTPKSSKIYVQIKYLNVAGGGFTVNVNDQFNGVETVGNNNDDLVRVYQFPCKPNETNTISFTNNIGGTGSAIKISKIVISEYICNDFND